MSIEPSATVLRLFTSSHSEHQAMELPVMQGVINVASSTDQGIQGSIQLKKESVESQQSSTRLGGNQQQQRLRIDMGRVVQHQESIEVPILSPPAIRKGLSLSTAATTITSNLHSTSLVRETPFTQPGVYHGTSPICDAMASSSRWSRNYTIEADDDDVQNTDIPPICEIRIPTTSRLHRQALVGKRRNDIDGDTTTSTQNLSNDAGDGSFDCHNDTTDYKNMYLSSQREIFALRGQVSGIQEANRKLKRQLIEMQKQIYAYSRNKRQAVSSCKNSNPSTENDAPWSIPTCFSVQQHRSVAVIRHPTETVNNLQNTPTLLTKPTGMVTAIPEITSSASKGVSMSVSSEEGNSP
jgi:hypothetical protein